MVWIHGGAFIFGSGAQFDGSTLARRHRLVVVTINYRLGALGFLALPSLDQESPRHVSGNYAILDQQAALKWVKHNIRAFGGDPNKVTVAGESAGGISICEQLVSPQGGALFRGAIIESGPCWPLATMADAEKRGRELAAKLACDKVSDEAACMRSKSAEQVVAAMPGSLEGPLIWAPVIDGQVIPKQTDVAFRAGTFNRVPIINGSNRDEGTLFIAFGKPVPAQDYKRAVGAFAHFGSRTPAASGGTDNGASKVVLEYPLEAYQSPSEGLAAALGDAIFSCPIAGTSALLSSFVPAYEYEFNDRDAPEIFLVQPPFPLGAYHASEIQYVFQSKFPDDGKPGRPGFTPAQGELSDHIADYWSAFIKNGNPDATSPAWLPTKASDPKILSLSPKAIQYESDFDKVHHCAFWRSLQPH